MHLRGPRLLPATILAMAALLGVKSADLLGLAGPALAASTQPAAPIAAPANGVPAAATVSPTVLSPNAVAPLGQAPADSPISASERTLLQDLHRRRSELDTSSAALASRESVAAAAEKRLGARLDELTALQKRLESLDAARRARDEASWQGLVHVYEAMKPRDAAVIFDDLDMTVLLHVLDRMKDRKAAPILAAMQPERAREVTAQLAELRTNVNRVPESAAATATPSH